MPVGAVKVKSRALLYWCDPKRNANVIVFMAFSDQGIYQAVIFFERSRCIPFIISVLKQEIIVFYCQINNDNNCNTRRRIQFMYVEVRFVLANPWVVP